MISWDTGTHRPLGNAWVNVSDQSSIFIHRTKMLISKCWKYFLAFNVLNIKRTDGWLQTFPKKETQKENTSFLHYFDTQYTHHLFTTDGSDGTQNDHGYPANDWGFLSRRLGGPSGTQIAFTILFATSICNKMPYTDTVYNLRQGRGSLTQKWLVKIDKVGK